ncbi:hypothetical protein ABK040_014410 [Willaertia magna]
MIPTPNYNNQSQPVPTLSELLNEDEQSVFTEFELDFRKTIQQIDNLPDDPFYFENQNEQTIDRISEQITGASLDDYHYDNSRLNTSQMSNNTSTSTVNLSFDNRNIPVISNNNNNNRNKFLAMFETMEPIKEVLKKNVPIIESINEDNEEEIEDLDEDFDLAKEQIDKIYEKRLSDGTIYLRNYAARAYKTFYNSKRYDRKFMEYQPNPFPIQKYTFGAFLYEMRKTKKYSHSTCNWVFLHNLCAICKDNDLGDPMKEYGNFLRGILRGFLRKFGNNIDKVTPCINYFRDAICQSLDLTTVRNTRTNAILKQGRLRGLRADSWEYAKLHYLTWKKHIISDKWILINTDLTIIKDKVLMTEPRLQTATGELDISRCANVALLLYLADERQVFEAGDSASVLLTGNFKYKKGCELEPIFTKPGTTLVATSKDLSNTIINASKIVDPSWRITFRSLRAGCLCQAFLEDIVNNNRIREETINTMVQYIGWKHKICMLPYVRWIVTKYNNVTAILELHEKDSNQIILNDLIKEIRDDNYIPSIHNVGNTKDLNKKQLKEMIYNNGYIPLDINNSKRINTDWKITLAKKSPTEKMRLYYIIKNDKLNLYLNERKSIKKNKGNVWQTLWRSVTNEHCDTLSGWEDLPDYRKLIGMKLAITSQLFGERKRSFKQVVGGNDLIAKWNDKIYYDLIKQKGLDDFTKIIDEQAKSPIKQTKRKIISPLLTLFEKQQKKQKETINQLTYEEELQKLIDKQEEEKLNLIFKHKQQKKELAKKYNK